MIFDQVFLTKLIFDQTLFCWRGPSDGQWVVATVAQENRRLGKKGIKIVVGLDYLARLSRNDATGCFCLFGGRSHRHGKIVVFVIVLAFFFFARDQFFVVVAALVVAACPSIINGMRLVA
jgi:hypothetical protein